LESEDPPDVYNDASEIPQEIVAEAGTEDAAAKAAAEEGAAAAAKTAAWAAEAKARAEAKVQAAAAAEAVAKAEAKAAADAAKVALAKAGAEAAVAAQLVAEQAAVKEKEAVAAAKEKEVAAAAAAQVTMAATASAVAVATPLAVAGADLEADDSGDGEKFVTVVTQTAADASGRLSQLSIDDARAGLWLLSQRHVETSKSKLVAFKSHTLDLAQTACAPAPEGGSVGGALWKDVQWRQMVQLPLGAVYGLMALLFVALFAVVHYPAKYVPLGMAYTKRKLVEHGVVEKASDAVLAMRTHAKTALQKGLETDVGKKGLEIKIKMGGMASQLAGSSAVSGSVAMADSIRLKVGDKLRQQGGPAPTEASVVPASPAGEEKV